MQRRTEVTCKSKRPGRSQEAYSGSPSARAEAAAAAAPEYLLPRFVLIGVFLALSLATIWFLLTDEPWLAGYAAFAAAVAMGRDTMRTLARADAAPVPANTCPHRRYVAWELRDRGDMTL